MCVMYKGRGGEGRGGEGRVGGWAQQTLDQGSLAIWSGVDRNSHVHSGPTTWQGPRGGHRGPIGTSMPPY